MSGAFREARRRAGLTQAELAELAGVSRQTVSAVESGRHVPAVDAAIRLADALGEPVAALFAPRPEGSGPVLDEPLRDGDYVVASRVGDRLRAAPLRSLVAGDGAWAAPDGVVEDGEVRLLPGAPASALVVVGCDPVLGLCETLLNRGARRLMAVSASSGAAAAALEGGRAHAAVVHGPPGDLPEPAGAPGRVHLARWQVGIGVAAGLRARTVDAVLERVALVQREEAAASQQALARAAARAGRPVPRARERAAGHIDAARRAAIGGCAAVMFEPAARQQGLRFIPLETHDVELWIDARFADHPGARALGDLIASAAFARRVRMIGGYDLEHCGIPTRSESR